VLPDFLSLRRELEKHLIVRLTAMVHQKEPILAQITGLTLQEGDTIAYDQMTEAGMRTVSEDFKEGRAEFSVAYKEVATLSGEKLEAKLNEIAEDLARQHSEAVQAVLDRTTREVGNALDAGGTPLTREMHLQMMERVEMNFDPKTGRPEMTFWASQKMIESFQAAMDEWEKDPEFLQKSKEIMARKYEEWRDRESRRKLVD
jgi:hypothetical protein